MREQYSGLSNWPGLAHFKDRVCAVTAFSDMPEVPLQFLEGMKLPALSLPRTSVTDQGPARLRALRCRRMLDPNNKIKTMQRKAYGFRDKEFFKLKILAGHEAKYALVG